MSHEQQLSSLLDRLRKNRENVPEEILKTKYAAAYAALCEQIRAELRSIALESLRGIRARPEEAEEIRSTRERAYSAGGHSRAIGRAAFKAMDAAQATATAKAAGRDFITALRKLEEQKPGALIFEGETAP